nr:dna replication licensing factor mcm6 [Quercus suber]
MTALVKMMLNQATLQLSQLLGIKWSTQALVMRLRQHEETITQEGTGLAGMRQRDLIQCYYREFGTKGRPFDSGI